MTDDERRKWLAGLRLYDRAAIPSAGGRYLRGCHVLGRRDANWCPEDPIWDVDLDATGFDDERRTFVHESELQPPPYPGMTGNIIVEPGPERMHRRRRPKARTASA
jgi:hypothetical protein